MCARPAAQPALDLWPAKELTVARLLAQAGDAYKQSAMVLIEKQKSEHGTAAGTAGTAVPARPNATAVAAATARAKVAAATSAAQHARRSQFQQRHGRKGHPRSEEGAWPLPRDPQNRGRSRRSALNQPTRRGHGSPGMMHGGPSTGRRCQTRTTGRSAGRRGQAVDAVS